MKTAQEWYDEGDALLYKGKYEDANKCYDEALALDNKFMPAYRGKFRYFGTQGRYEEGIKWCEKSLEIDPTYKFGLNGKGHNLYCLLRYSEALEILNKAIELYPTWDFPYLNKGNCLKQLNKCEEAIESYKKYIELNSDDHATAFRNIALCYWDLNKYEETKEWLDKAIVADPNHPIYLVSRGVALNKLGRRKEALADFRKAKKSLDNGFVDVDLTPSHIEDMKRVLDSISELNDIEEEAEALVEKANRENPVVKKLINNIAQLRQKKENVSDDLLTKMKNKDNSGTEALLKEMQQLKEEFQQVKNELATVKNEVKQMKSQLEDIKEELDNKLDDFAKKLDKELEKKNMTPDDRVKVKEYFKAFVQTFSSAHVTSQVIDSGQVQLNANSAKATVLSVIVSFTPFIGSLLSTGVKSLGDFLQSQEMKTQARKMKGLAPDATELSQLIGGCGYEIVLNQKKQEQIIKITKNDLKEISSSLFHRISKFCTNLAEKIDVYLYSELYKTPSAKLGHNDANILIEEWLGGDIDPFSAQEHFVDKIVSDKKQEEAKQEAKENASFTGTDKVQGERSKRSSCCNLF